MPAADAILCWPQYADYPLFRRFLRDNRSRFGRVLVVFTPHAGNDLREWVSGHIDAECLVSPEPDKDWRHTAVNFALDQSRAEWVWFAEQDFIVHDPEAFWDAQERATGPLGFRDEHRWHPASLLVPRAVVERTSRYFGPEPVDHFVTFSRELDALTTVEHLPPCYEHLQGLSQNHFLTDSGIADGIFKPPRWRQYLADCLAAGIDLEPGWRARAEQEVGSAHP